MSSLNFQVRVLSFLELERKVPLPDIPKIKYTYKGEGGEFTEEYTLADFDEAIAQPKADASESEWERYLLYKKAVSREKAVREADRKYIIDCTEYILKTCLPKGVNADSLTPEEIDEVVRLATIPEVKEEDIDAALASVFQSILERSFNIKEFI